MRDTASVGHGKGTELQLTREVRFPHSIGLLYSTFTAFIGFAADRVHSSRSSTMTRASTLLLALLVLNTLLGVLCLVVARGERRSAALRLWGWGLLVYSAGLLVTLPSAIPVTIAKIAGNSLIAYAPILNVAGLLQNTSFRLNRRWTTLGFAASVLPIVVNHLRPTFVVLVDLLSPAPIANVLFILGADD